VPLRVIALVVISLPLVGCVRPAPSGGNARDDDKVVQEGDAARGDAILRSGAHGCAACHQVPGVRFPRGVAGPPLSGMRDRAFIAGQLPNTPGMLVAFLQDPPSLVPRTGMPDVRMSLEDARHVAAYLYSMERDRDP
jgi:cytochrome c2